MATGTVVTTRPLANAPSDCGLCCFSHQQRCVAGRIDLALFNQFVGGLAIADVVHRAETARGEVQDAEKAVAAAKKEAVALAEREREWVGQQRREAEEAARLAEKLRRREENLAAVQAKDDAMAAAIGASGAAAVAAGHKMVRAKQQHRSKLCLNA